MDPDWMQRSPYSVAQWIPIECSGFHAALPNGSWLNAVDFMQCDWMHWITCSIVKYIQSECSGLHAAWGNVSRLDAVESMQHAAMDTRLHAVESMQHCVIDNNLRPWIPCIKIQCRGFNAPLWNGPEWMQWIPCSVDQWIPIECSEFHEARLNAVDSMQNAAVYLNWMRWIPCSLV